MDVVADELLELGLEVVGFRDPLGEAEAGEARSLLLLDGFAEEALVREDAFEGELVHDQLVQPGESGLLLAEVVSVLLDVLRGVQHLGLVYLLDDLEAVVVDCFAQQV